MTIPESCDVEVVHDLLIPMRDGVRLAANLYRPAGGSVPCLVNYLPYHKDGRGGLWYDGVHRFFARHGYATLVVDFRGLGCSEGVNNIPFDAQEGQDGHDVVEWAAAQSWCSGKIGMWGTSYGGITALKTAAERPPHLQAIVPINATWDNYTDFLLLGGCRNGFWANGDWGPRMVAYNLTPPLAPDPDGRLGRLWAERLEHSRPWCLDWYDARDEPARWRTRSIAVERVTAATFAVCGWWDFYAQGTLDYFRRLTAPRKLLMGPWKHAMPDLSLTAPVGLLELMVKWWDRWLKGEEGAAAEPAITLFVQGGGWRYEEAWPPVRNEEQTLYLPPGAGTSARPGEVARAQTHYQYDPTVGLDSISYDPWTTAVAEPGNHNGDDGRSLCFTTDPLAEDQELCGQARVVMTIRPAVSGLQYAMKLCDVSPDGYSRLVTLGWSPDTGRTDQQSRTVEIALRSTAYLFRKGHRIRLAAALADFPRLWPTPDSGEIYLEDQSHNPPRLLLPRTPPLPPGLPAPELPPPASVRSTFEVESGQSWRLCRELVGQTAALESKSVATYRLRDGGTVAYYHEYTASVKAAEPAGAAIDCRSSVEVRRPTGAIVVKTVSRFTPGTVTIEAEVEQDGAIIWRKEWSRRRDDG